MSITELKIYFDLSPESKSKILDKYAKKFDLGYFFVDSEDGYCYLFDENGKEKDISLVHEINEDIILLDIKKIAIPNNVTSIGYKAFRSCSKLTSVTIPNSVTNIEYAAFSGCIELESVMIPDSVTSIGNFAFSWCKSLTSVTIPDSVTSIGYQTFYNCSGLKSVMIGNGMTSIKSAAFSGCSGLVSVTIPDSVTSIEDWVFEGCNNLKSIIFKGKTIDQVKAMENYPFGTEDESVIKGELN